MNTENIHNFNNFKNNVYSFSNTTKIYIYDIHMYCYITMTFAKFVKSQKLQNTFNMCPPWF